MGFRRVIESLESTKDFKGMVKLEIFTDYV
jgi:hypothetical protein